MQQQTRQNALSAKPGRSSKEAKSRHSQNGIRNGRGRCHHIAPASFGTPRNPMQSHLWLSTPRYTRRPKQAVEIGRVERLGERDPDHNHIRKIDMCLAAPFVGQRPHRLLQTLLTVWTVLSQAVKFENHPSPIAPLPAHIPKFWIVRFKRIEYLHLQPGNLKSQLDDDRSHDRLAPVVAPPVCPFDRLPCLHDTPAPSTILCQPRPDLGSRCQPPVDRRIRDCQTAAEIRLAKAIDDRPAQRCRAHAEHRDDLSIIYLRSMTNDQRFRSVRTTARDVPLRDVHVAHEPIWNLETV